MQQIQIEKLVIATKGVLTVVVRWTRLGKGWYERVDCKAGDNNRGSVRRCVTVVLWDMVVILECASTVFVTIQHVSPTYVNNLAMNKVNRHCEHCNYLCHTDRILYAPIEWLVLVARNVTMDHTWRWTVEQKQTTITLLSLCVVGGEDGRGWDDGRVRWYSQKVNQWEIG